MVSTIYPGRVQAQWPVLEGVDGWVEIASDAVTIEEPDTAESEGHHRVSMRFNGWWFRKTGNGSGWERKMVPSRPDNRLQYRTASMRNGLHPHHEQLSLRFAQIPRKLRHAVAGVGPRVLANSLARCEIPLIGAVLSSGKGDLNGHLCGRAAGLRPAIIDSSRLRRSCRRCGRLHSGRCQSLASAMMLALILRSCAFRRARELP